MNRLDAAARNFFFSLLFTQTTLFPIAPQCVKPQQAFCSPSEKIVDKSLSHKMFDADLPIHVAAMRTSTLAYSLGCDSPDSSCAPCTYYALSNLVGWRFSFFFLSPHCPVFIYYNGFVLFLNLAAIPHDARQNGGERKAGPSGQREVSERKRHDGRTTT